MLKKSDLQFWIVYRLTAARFWSHVDVKGPDECWLWAGCQLDGGYGAFSINGRLVKAHRVAHALSGRSFPDEAQVLHSCPGGDNPACCNPRHLRAGTHAENHADRKARGRSKNADRVPLLNRELAEEIRAEYARGSITQATLAQKHSISCRHLQRILSNRTWG